MNILLDCKNVGKLRVFILQLSLWYIWLVALLNRSGVSVRCNVWICCGCSSVFSPRRTWTAGWEQTSLRLHYPPWSPCGGPGNSGSCSYWQPLLDSFLSLPLSLSHTHTHTRLPLRPDTHRHHLWRRKQKAIKEGRPTQRCTLVHFS